MRDDDALDLSAWDAPPPPDGIADAVVARMGGTAVGLAMPDEPPSRKRWLVIAASAAAVLVVAAGAWAIVRGREKAPPASGEVIADRAQHVDLGGASVDLDRGADIRWQRTGGRLHVEQKAGTAVWRVGEEHVDIAAAAASPVTIDAAGARLKVEVPMNLSDARVIGASTVTAAAVAMVTVVVYEGHVQVHRGDQTVVVQPGSTYTVPPPTPPTPPTPPGPPVPPAPPIVGVATGAKKVAVLGLEGWNGDAVPRDLVDALRARANTGSFVLAPGSDKELADEKLLHNCAHEDISCMVAIGRDLGADVVIFGRMYSQRSGYEIDITWLDVANKSFGSKVSSVIAPDQAQGEPLRTVATAMFDTLARHGFLPEEPDEAIVQEVLAGNADELDACVRDEVAVVVTINSAGKATSIETEGPAGGHAASPCISQVIGGLAFPRSQHGGTYTRALKTSTCDVDALVQEGNGYLSIRGNPAAALAKYEAAIACKPDVRLYKLAFAAACKVPDGAKARTYWVRFTPYVQRTLLPLCLAQGISRDALDGVVKTCDADDLITKGEGADTRGDYADALSLMEKALACDPSQADRIAPMVVMEACKANDGAKALLYLDKVKEPLHSKLAMVCAKQGVTSFRTTCDADQLQQKGTDYVAAGQHAAALLAFEQAIKCKPGDAKLIKLAFMESCNIKNVDKARRYYNQIAADERGALAQICMRQGITTDQLANAATAPATGTGSALITCNPPARILIDGNDTGQTTPATLELAPGKHKLTLQLGGDRFTYPLTIRAGETETISKDLQ